MAGEPSSKRCIYLISDLHLEPSRNRLTRAFTAFLKKISVDAQALYILGDFVEAWIGDDNNSAFNRSLKATLTDFVSNVAPIYFIHGNRDFLIGDKFCQETGVIILPEHARLDLQGNTALLLHGDSLCTDDIAYQRFRTKVRNPAWQKKVLSYPLLVRQLIASYMRFRSRTANRKKSSDIMDVSETTVRSVFHEYNVPTMIHGHTHRPNRHHYHDHDHDQSRERIVLGDWGDYLWYVEIKEGDIELKREAIP